MKPLRVELENFGPYGRHAVDLTAFREEGLFLIHGDTGSGKSTLLDAMTYALYGKGLGTRDRDDFLRNKNAASDQPTSAALTFTLGDRTYRVRRVMEYERAARRGGGVTRQRPEAVLECLAGDPSFETVSTPRKCDEAVERLLGLPYEQFTRLIVLPQGEFRDLLLARADDREQLLERIFGTALYKSVEVKLRDLERQRERAFDTTRAKVESLLASVGAESRDALEASAHEAFLRAEGAAAHAEEAERRSRDAVRALGEHRERVSRNRERAELRARLAKLAAEEPEIAALAREFERAERAEQCRDALADAESRLRRRDETEASLTQSQRAYEEAARAASDPGVSHAREESLARAHAVAVGARERLERLVRQVDEVEREARELALARSHREASEARRDECARHAEEVRKAREERAKPLDELRRTASQEPAARMRVRELEQRQQGARERSELDTRLRETERALREAERKESGARERTRRARDERDEARRRERASLAARIARTLRDGEACPVCGSERHPAPAPDDAGIDERALQEAEQRHDRELAAQQRAEQERAKLEGELAAQRERLDTQEAADGATEEELEEAAQVARRRLNEVRDAVRRVEEAARAIERLDEELRRVNSTRAEVEAELARSSATIAQVEPRVERARAELGEGATDAAGVAVAVEKARADERRASEEVESTRKRRAGVEAARASAAARVDQARRDADEARGRYDAARTRLEASMRAKGFEDEGELQAARRGDGERSKLRAAVESYRDERARAEEATTSLGLDEPGAEPERLAELDADAARWRETHRDAQQAVGASRARHEQLRALLAQVDVLGASTGETAARWAVARRVSDIVNGKNEGKARLSRYVLLEQFDRVVECASARLEVMSDGRFRLRRKETRQTGGEFELVVDDAYTGAVERSAATLSGGEMFMASLAMALGLSDVVQAWSGGVRLESLFVDEGFGSLDEESLDKAVAVLEQLRESRRMVGVVSHVQELRKRIPARLEVVRTDAGSTTRTTLRGGHVTRPVNREGH